MIDLSKCKRIFIDFDGVIVDSNTFKESAIENALYEILGKNIKTIEALNYFNLNAGISREKKLSLYFNDEQISKVLKIYSQKCFDFFQKAKPNPHLYQFLNYIKTKHSHINIFILSGGEKREIEEFLNQNNLSNIFDAILASEQTKIEHLKTKQATENDIFIGDSKNDLQTSINYGLKFILFEEYKSFKSFPKDEFIKLNFLLRTKNFESLLNLISL